MKTISTNIFFSVQWGWQQHRTFISCRNSSNFWILFSSLQERNLHMFPDFNWYIMELCHSIPSCVSGGCQMVILLLICAYWKDFSTINHDLFNPFNTLWFWKVQGWKVCSWKVWGFKSLGLKCTNLIKKMYSNHSHF